MRIARPALALLTALLLTAAGRGQEEPKHITNGEPLTGTKPLTMEGDIAAQLVEGVDKFLLREIDKSVERRAKYWERDVSSAEAYDKSIEPNRKRLAHILGVRDARIPFDAPELVATPTQPALVGKGDGYEIFAVRWPAFGDVHGEGLLLVPSADRKKVADVVAIPDADQTPEQFVGLTEGVAKDSQIARRLAESGCRVIVPVLIDRHMEKRHAPGGNGGANLTSREYLYRSAFELGRQLIGYEVQKVLAAVDWFANEGGKDAKIGVMGYGEGGMLALYAGALDTRITAVCVSGYFANRNNIWQEPIDRNVFGLLEQFGDAELAAMLKPRHLFIEHCKGPELTLPSEGGAPARLVTPTRDEVDREFDRSLPLGKRKSGIYFGRFDGDIGASIGGRESRFGDVSTLHTFLHDLGNLKVAEAGGVPQHLRKTFDPKPRQLRQQHEIDRHNQKLLTDSPYVRAEFTKELYDAANSKSPEKYEAARKKYRDIFYNDVVGRFDEKPLPFNARSRKAYEAEKWTGYEVVLDVFPDVIAYGILLLPKDLKKDEKRPVVVCQHGLEGRPQDTIGKAGYPYYKAFAAELANRGFITFAPQNLYIGHDKFRTLQRKANPLGKTLFSVIVPQHQQITDWLKTLPNVDGRRIGFYGLSYGGKSAMRIPPLVDNYCLSICSADFNEWVWKNASTRAPQSYVWTGEYEIFEWDLGSTFNYSEMAALIAPRPFMVERGHFDGVSVDEEVGYEFAKVRYHYAARLGLGDRTEIEWFVGPHTINGKGTFAFLHRHLNWPAPK
ncbi:MAG TPA: dienelactone hydrolase family protein [Gemmataceae bacterium]|nr:dienelactone hydrolase family protein [Gemmataceae bacterium]